MIEQTRTTSINPGSAQSVQILTVRVWLMKSLIYLGKRRFRMSLFFFLAEGLNIFQSYRKPQHVSKCSVCANPVDFFLHHASDLRVSWNAVCPHCNSRSRHRGLWFLYKEILSGAQSPFKVLHFSPEPVFYSLFNSYQQISYATADYRLQDVDFKEDIQKLSFEDASYDLILCNHVIEHVRFTLAIFDSTVIIVIMVWM
jgi:hypothetical protein